MRGIVWGTMTGVIVAGLGTALLVLAADERLVEETSPGPAATGAWSSSGSDCPARTTRQDVALTARPGTDRPAQAPIALEATGLQVPRESDQAPTVRWAARVTDEEAHPVANAALWIAPIQALAGLPIGDVLARLHDTALHAEHDIVTAMTDADGYATVERPAQPSAGFSMEHVSFVLVQHAAHAILIEELFLRKPDGDGELIASLTLRPPCAVSGRVVSADGTPLADTTVTLTLAEHSGLFAYGYLDELGGSPLQVRTGTDGRYVLDHVEPGSGWITFLHPEFVDRLADIQLVAHETTALQDAVLLAGGAISGRVIDTQGRPVAGAALHPVKHVVRSVGGGCTPASLDEDDDIIHDALAAARDRAGDCTRITAQDGSFQLVGLEVHQEQVNTLYVEAAGFEPAEFSDIAFGSEGVELVLERAARLQVTVVDRPSGQALFDASIDSALRVNKASHWFGEKLAAEPRTPGSFTVVGPGTHASRFKVRAPGHATRLVILEGCAPGTEEEIVVELDAEAVVTGFVSIDGQPATDVLVSVHPDDSMRRGEKSSARTDAHGRYRIDQLAAGTWKLSAAADDCRTVSRTIELHTGQHQDVDLALHATGKLTGIARSASSGRALASHELILEAAKAGQTPALAKTRAGRDGRFRFKALDPGAYTLSSNRLPPVAVTITASGTSELQLEIPESGRLSGLVMHEGQPAPGVLVYARRSGGKRLWRRTNAEGRYAFACHTPGRYAAWLAHENEPDVEAIAVPLSMGDHRSMDFVIAGQRIHAVMRDQNGRVPLRRLKLQLDRADGAGETHTLAIHTGGEATSPILPPGDYIVSLEPDDGRRLVSPQRILIGSHTQPVDVELRVDTAARVEGLVRTDTGRPTPFRCEVSLHANAPGNAGGKDAPTRQTWTEGGGFAFDGLEAGVYTLTVTRPNHLGASTAPVTVVRVQLDGRSVLPVTLTLP